MPVGNYVFYGVREFGMTAAMGGIALHGGFIPYGGTFLVFSDYARNAVRMAALMGIRSILVYTHDSIGLGEDGPTHQAVEHLASLRLIPNLEVWRPCDVPETMAAWREALVRHEGPSALALSRQKTAHEPRGETELAYITGLLSVLRYHRRRCGKSRAGNALALTGSNGTRLAWGRRGCLARPPLPVSARNRSTSPIAAGSNTVGLRPVR